MRWYLEVGSCLLLAPCSRGPAGAVSEGAGRLAQGGPGEGAWPHIRVHLDLCRSHAGPELREDGAGGERGMRVLRGSACAGRWAGCWEQPGTPPTHSAGPSSWKERKQGGGNEEPRAAVPAKTVPTKPRRSQGQSHPSKESGFWERPGASPAQPCSGWARGAARGVRSGAAGALASRGPRVGLGVRSWAPQCPANPYAKPLLFSLALWP